jgi:hypothetical protein
VVDVCFFSSVGQTLEIDPIPIEVSWKFPFRHVLLFSERSLATTDDFIGF